MIRTVLKLDCPDRIGLVARLTGYVAEHGGNLLEVNQYTEPQTGWFFTRIEIDTETLDLGLQALRSDFALLARELRAKWTIRQTDTPMRTVIMVSKLGHCLVDLLWRWRSGELPMEIPLVISNHEDFRHLVEREGIEYHHVPILKTDKSASFSEVRRILESINPHLIVLARYMQILPKDVCKTFAGRIMNIHHSFLPSFAGASPYRRAWDRGVKLIGATCHYATAELDEGPIIDQEVVRVEHFHSPEDLLRLGRDCERLALARGVRYHLSDRVLLHGNKTIVFRD
jgi:formyltetrahydrofolate deformylase